jgi:sporulation protein YlmC with PRC-barrel domain
VSDLKADDFHLGSRVFSSDGKEVGELVHVLVEADYKLRALVVKEGRLGSVVVNDEFIVPRDAVGKIEHDRVELQISSGEARRLPPYLTIQRRGASLSEEIEDFAVTITANPEVPSWLEQVANKPEGELEIDGGENVMLGTTGRRLGTVKDVLFDGDQLMGVVLLPDGLFKREVVLPRRFLDRSDDAALFAKLDETDIEHLERFEAE